MLKKLPRRGVVKRRYQFIEKKQQARFALTVTLFALFFPFFLAALILSPVNVFLLLGPEAETVRPAIIQIATFCLGHFWVVLIALAFIAYASILFSHKVFGPIRRFESALVQKKWHPGEKVFCSLRKGDFFREFSLHLQDFLDTCEMPEPPSDPEPESPAEDEAVEDKVTDQEEDSSSDPT
ncbi:MAG: hypothetical protein V3R94_12935 [Acidobacteriota bacterium]